MKHRILSPNFRDKKYKRLLFGHQPTNSAQPVAADAYVAEAALSHIAKLTK